MDPINVTELVQRYRMILRDVWNRGIWCNEKLRKGESIDYFNQCKPSLFDALIAYPLDSYITEFSQGKFSVVPITTTCLLRLQINTAQNSLPDCGHWYPFEFRYSPGDISLSMVDIMQLDMFRYIDLSTYVVRIDNFPQHPEHTNRHALIEAEYAEVFFTPESQPEP